MDVIIDVFFVRFFEGLIILIRGFCNEGTNDLLIMLLLMLFYCCCCEKCEKCEGKKREKCEKRRGKKRGKKGETIAYLIFCLNY